MDEIVEEVRCRLPDVDVAWLPVTGRILRLACYLEAGREAELAQFGLTLADFDMLATMQHVRSASRSRSETYRFRWCAPRAARSSGSNASTLPG